MNNNNNNYVYFAPTTDFIAFKIGFSRTPHTRLHNIEKLAGTISFRHTYIFECLDAPSVEHFCHIHFNKFNVKLYEGDGSTEWFDFSIFKLAKSKLLRNIDLFQIYSHCRYLDKFSEADGRKLIRSKNKKVVKQINNTPITTAHPGAWNKLPEKIRNSRPMDYRFVDYQYASDKCKEFGITSARQYRAWQQAFNPAGFPALAQRTYENEWVSWDAFLQCEKSTEFAGTAKNTIKADELMPYDDALKWVQAAGFKSKAEYQEAWDAGKIPFGIPKHPPSRYPDFYGITPDGKHKKGWRYFLGKTPTPVK